MVLQLIRTRNILFLITTINSSLSNSLGKNWWPMLDRDYWCRLRTWIQEILLVIWMLVYRVDTSLFGCYCGPLCLVSGTSRCQHDWVLLPRGIWQSLALNNILNLQGTYYGSWLSWQLSGLTSRKCLAQQQLWISCSAGHFGSELSSRSSTPSSSFSSTTSVSGSSSSSSLCWSPLWQSLSWSICSRLSRMLAKWPLVHSFQLFLKVQFKLHSVSLVQSSCLTTCTYIHHLCSLVVLESMTWIKWRKLLSITILKVAYLSSFHSWSVPWSLRLLLFINWDLILWMILIWILRLMH